jgi:hypothetical protein
MIGYLINRPFVVSLSNHERGIAALFKNTVIPAGIAGIQFPGMV